MKKWFALVTVLILIVFLCACDDTTDTEYKLTVVDYWGYLAEPLDEYYKAGEEIEVHIISLSGPLGGVNLNGEDITEYEITETATLVYTVTMPAKNSILCTTQNGNIGYESTFSRAGSGKNADIYNGSLNANRLNSDGTRHLPIYKFDTLADLEKFKSDFGGESGFNCGWGEVPSFNDATEKYDGDFFAHNTLMLVYIDTNSGSYRFGLESVYLDENYFCIHIEQTNNPQVCTEDMAAWFITVAVPDSMVANCTDFDADLIATDANDTDNLTRPVTNLEFWIAENVDNLDFSKYQQKYGIFGGREYYGTGYVPTIDEYGQQIDPEHCVIYTVTAYPDYSDKERHVTHIYITDPTIEFYGITLNSSLEDFEYYIKQQGFEISSSSENGCTAKKGKYSITITKEWIRIRVEVENKTGIIF